MKGCTQGLCGPVDQERQRGAGAAQPAAQQHDRDHEGPRAGPQLHAEIKIISAITLKELLGPFDVVDYLESDIQQSEILVFPPFIDLLRKKVRRIHIGTHGAETSTMPCTSCSRIMAGTSSSAMRPTPCTILPLGKFETNDGILTVRNPDL